MHKHKSESGVRKNVLCVILAAGKGTRMKSSIPKVLHKVAGCEMLSWVITRAKEIADEIVVVVNREMAEDNRIKRIADGVLIAVQPEQRGTADALLSGMSKAYENVEELSFESWLSKRSVLVLYGDTPMLKRDTLQKMLLKVDGRGNDQSNLCILAFHCEHENRYGRLVLDVNQNLERIIEYKDSSELEKKITLCNSGVIAMRSPHLFKLLKEIKDEGY